MKLTTALIASAFLAAGSSVKAQTGRTFGNGTLPEFLKPYDINNDGVLSAEEREAARKGRADRIYAALEKWDLNGDGKLSPDEIEAARKAARAEIDAIRTERFNDADKDGDGYLSLAEFTAMIPAAPVGAPAPDISKIFAYLDANNDGKISLAEFLSACPPPPPVPPLPPLLPPFGQVDLNHDGIIGPVEFADFIHHLPPPPPPALRLTEDQIAALFAHLDTNNDNGITPDEWPVKDDPTHPPLPPKPLPLPAFASADKNADGFVDPEEFAAAACASHIPSLVAREMFHDADINDDGKLDATEYASIPAPTATTP